MGVRLAAMRRELNIPPVHAEASARRARALVKYPNLKTWIGVLAKYPFKSSQSLWYGGGIKWMERYCKTVDSKMMGRASDGYQAKAEKAYKEVLQEVWRSMQAGNEPFQGYSMRGYEVTAWALPGAVPVTARAQQVQLGRGLRLMHLCRTDSWWTAERMARQHFDGMEEYLNQCPCCGEGLGETMGHIFLTCSAWEKQRQEHLGGILRVATNISRSILGRSGSMCEESVLVLMLGGEIDGRRVENWLPCEAPTADCGAFQVARFLQCIEAPRRALIPHEVPLPRSNARRVNARKGKAAQARR